jgi:hypothetical protein
MSPLGYAEVLIGTLVIVQCIIGMLVNRHRPKDLYRKYPRRAWLEFAIPFSSRWEGLVSVGDLPALRLWRRRLFLGELMIVLPMVLLVGLIGLYLFLFDPQLRTAREQQQWFRHRSSTPGSTVPLTAERK